MINIVLYEPEIPGNTGNIMRTAVATNSKLHLIEPLGFSLDEKYLKRSSANYMDKLKNEGTFYYLTRYGKKPHTSFDYSDSNENIYLVFGKESSGIPKEILRNDLGRCMRMPMTKEVRALNLSNTVAIMVYEVLRQQNYNDLLQKEPHKSENYIEED